MIDEWKNYIMNLTEEDFDKYDQYLFCQGIYKINKTVRSLTFLITGHVYLKIDKKT